MVLELKLRKVGNSVGLVLPREALALLNADSGHLPSQLFLDGDKRTGFMVAAGEGLGRLLESRFTLFA